MEQVQRNVGFPGIPIYQFRNDRSSILALRTTLYSLSGTQHAGCHPKHGLTHLCADTAVSLFWSAAIAPRGVL